MKKIVPYLFILVVIVVLSGCSIPLGDLGKLDISKDGVNVVVDDENSESEKSDGAEDDEKVPVDLDDAALAEDDEEDSDGGNDGKNSANKGSSTAGSYVCDELIQDQRGNERALKKLKELLPPKFHLSDCVFIESTDEGYHNSHQAVTVDTYFQIDGYWADIYDEYQEYLNDAGFGPLRLREDTKNMSGEIYAKDPDYDIDMYFRQLDNEDAEVTRIRIHFYHYDEPREE